MFIMVMVIVGHGLGRPGGQAARSEEKGSLVELGDKPSGGHVCLHPGPPVRGLPALGHARLDVPARESPEEVPGCLFLGSGTDGSTLS